MVSSYNFDPVFRSKLLEGPKSTFIINRNLQNSENNYENCYYLDLDLERSKTNINNLLVSKIDTQKGPWIIGDIVIP